MARVLIVDDDDTVANVVVGYLERAGHIAEHIGDGRSALKSIESDPPDLVVLDLMLPEIDGLEVCRQVRKSLPDLPIIMLTALSEAEDRIAGLEVGADDYVTKPFSPRELVLRIDSVLRRSVTARPANADLLAGPIRVDRAARRAWKGEDELALTVRELELLAYLLEHPGVAFNREQLMREVWGWTFGDQSTVTVHVRRLREKVEDDPTRPTLIQTVWGIGYRLEVPCTSP
ncbi:MAG: response regulator transcription factor [Actinomycetota bacterium]|nr:response regulator transcription factor [Actinomycetota bacterium]